MRQRKRATSIPSRKARTDKKQEGPIRRKLIAFEPEVLDALTLLARDRMQEFQDLADEAFADVLKKHGRPTNLKQALRASAKAKE
jgi:hypothetical protein